MDSISDLGITGLLSWFKVYGPSTVAEPSRGVGGALSVSRRILVSEALDKTASKNGFIGVPVHCDSMALYGQNLLDASHKAFLTKPDYLVGCVYSEVN